MNVRYLLRGAVRSYMAVGVVFSLLLFAAVFVYGYERGLRESIGRFEALRAKAERVRGATASMVSVMERIKGMLPDDYDGRTHRELMLLTLDAVNERIRGRVSVANFVEESGEIRLPVHMEIPVKRYSTFVSHLAYIQSRGLPRFRIESVAVTRMDVWPWLVAKIDGAIVLPSTRLGEAPETSVPVVGGS
ncbi:MAG TPA: hypothetical protein ENJ37_01215 [Deltaproteobacteria bacterium]|nr:hypothetical protein [Deltaproteobacteria bacterium]